MTRRPTTVNMKAVRMILQEKEMKYSLDHDKANQAKVQRALILDEECFALAKTDAWK